MSNHPTEEKFPEQVKRFKEIIESMYAVHLEKNKDYSPANILVTGMGGVIVRMWDKMARIYNLMGTPMPNLASEIEKVKKRIIEEIENHPDDIEFMKKAVDINLDYLYELQSVDFSNLIRPEQVEAANEPLIDSFKDLANYAIIGMLVMEGKWGR